MNIIDVISIFSIMVILAAIPSASVALVVARSATMGASNGVAVAVGIVLGDLVFIVLAIFSLAEIAESMGWLFLTIRYAGATYLIWLGFTLIRSTNRTPVPAQTEKTPSGNLITSFAAGFFLTLGDVKAIFFYVSLFPAFMNLETLTLPDLTIVLAITVIAVGGVKVIYALSADRIAKTMHGFKFEQGVRKTAGGLMIGTGTYLIAKT